MNTALVPSLVAPAAVLLLRTALSTNSSRRRVDQMLGESRGQIRTSANRQVSRFTSWRSPDSRLRVFGVFGVSVFALVVTAMLASLLIGIGVGGAIWFGHRSFRRWRAAQIERSFDVDMLSCAEEFGRNLRAGLSSIDALTKAAQSLPNQPAMTELQRACRNSPGFTSALDHWPPPTRRSAHIVQLLRVGESLGGLRPQFVDAVLSSVRESDQLDGEIRALSDQARYSAVLMSLAPLLFAVVLVATDARSRDLLLHSPLGAVLLFVGLSLDGAGLLWMRRLVKRVESNS
jgi:tight adherence protein B